jgi:hypothetical protein
MRDWSQVSPPPHPCLLNNSPTLKRDTKSSDTSEYRTHFPSPPAFFPDLLCKARATCRALRTWLLHFAFTTSGFACPGGRLFAVSSSMRNSHHRAEHLALSHRGRESSVTGLLRQPGERSGADSSATEALSFADREVHAERRGVVVVGQVWGVTPLATSPFAHPACWEIRHPSPPSPPRRYVLVCACLVVLRKYRLGPKPLCTIFLAQPHRLVYGWSAALRLIDYTLRLSASSRVARP